MLMPDPIAPPLLLVFALILIWGVIDTTIASIRMRRKKK
jgi:hypothetical protein